MTNEEAIQILNPETRRETLRAIPVMEWIAFDQEACKLAVSALRAQQEQSNKSLTLEELREMDDMDVWVVYPANLSGEQLIMHALVEFDMESGRIWLTNNLGGRSIFDDIIEDGATIYRRKPERGAT